VQKAVIYVRMSKDKTGEELGVARQQEDALKVAEFRGWQVVRTEIDNDIGAAGKKTRPGFEAILSAIESGEVSAVIAWDMTRLTRNRRDTVRVIKAARRRSSCCPRLLRCADTRHLRLVAVTRADSHIGLALG